MKIAITREISPSIDRCELSHLEREPIRLRQARQQHRTYMDSLASLGCEVHCLPGEPGLPDSVFVEDTAVVLDEVAVLTHPGAESRREEVSSIERVLQPFRETLRIESPGILDGGDVLQTGRTLHVGLSLRSNREAVDQLWRLVSRFGYDVRGVPLGNCLHLKSAATLVGEDTVLINSRLVDPSDLGPFRFIEVDPEEPAGANALLVGSTVVYPSAFPRTRRRLEAEGINVLTVPASELAKAEGGVTCCSLIFER